MKVRIISTGEIAKIADNAKVTLNQCDRWGNPVEVPFENIELIKDLSDITDITDWQQVRIQAAIAAMQGMCANPAYFELNSGCPIPEAAVIYADALVEKLKGE